MINEEEAYKLDTGQTDGYIDSFPEVTNTKQYSTGKTAAAFIALNNPVTNYGWKAADIVLTGYEELTYDGIEGYDALSDEERGKYEPKYWPIIEGAKSPWQAGRKVLKAQEEEHYKHIIENGTAMGTILGAAYVTPLNPTTWIPMLRAAAAPTFIGRFAKNVAQSLPQIFAGAAAEEFGLYWAQETRTVEESLTNTVTGTIFGSVMSGLGAAIFGPKMAKQLVKETVEGAEVKTLLNEQGDIVGIKIQDGGSVGEGGAKEILFSEMEGSSAGAALTNPESLPYKETLEDLTLVGTQYPLHPAKLIFGIGGNLLRNPVHRGMVSPSVTTRSVINSLYEHNNELLGSQTKTINKPPSVQSLINQYTEVGEGFKLKYLDYFYEQLGLDESGSRIGNAVKSSFVKDQTGYMSAEEFGLKASIAITEGGIDVDFPVVSKAAKYVIDEIIKPYGTDQLVKLEVMAPNFKPFGAEQHLQRVYNVPWIVSNRPFVEDWLQSRYKLHNQSIVTASSRLESLHVDLGKLETLKAKSQSNDYDKKIINARKKINREKKQIRENQIKGKYEPATLVGDAGMSWDEIQQIKKLRKPIKKAKIEIKHAEEELNVYKRQVNNERKPFEANKTPDETELKLQNKVDESKAKLKKIRDDMQNFVQKGDTLEPGDLPRSIFFETKGGNLRLKKPNYGTLKFRKILDDEEIELAAKRTINNIINMSPDQHAESFMGNLKSGSAGSTLESVMNPRVLLEADKLLYNVRPKGSKEGMLVTDLRRTIPTFLTRMGRLIETDKWARARGYVPGKNSKYDWIAESISDDYSDLRKALNDKYKSKIENASDAKKARLEKRAKKERTKLHNKEKDDIDLVKKSLARIMGEVSMQDGKMIRSFRTLNNWSYASQLGLMLISCLGESVAPIFRLGAIPAVRDGVVPALRGIVQRGNKRQIRNALADINIGVDTETTILNLKYQQGNDAELPAGFIERRTKDLANIMGIINLSNPWMDTWNRVWGTATLSNMYRRAKKFSQGKLKGNELKQFKVLGMDDLDLCNRIVKQFETPGMGEKLNGAYIPNLRTWADAEASQRFEIAVRQELRSTLFGGKNIASYPLELDYNGVANSFFMFCGWGFNAYANYTAPLFQRFNMDKVIGIGAIWAMNCLSDPLRKLAKGEELTDEDYDPTNLAVKGFFNSGLFSVIADYTMRANAGYDIFPELNTSKVSDKNGLELIPASPTSLFNFIGTGAAMAFNGANKKDLKTMKRNTPLANSILFQKAGNDYIDSLDIPETRGEAKKIKQRESGEVPVKKPRKKKKGRD